MKKPSAPSPAKAPEPAATHDDGVFPARGKRLPMPHERDESSGRAGPGDPPRPEIRQAQRDLAQGQVDTDMRSTPGLDSQRRESLVPGAASVPAQQRQRRGEAGS